MEIREDQREYLNYKFNEAKEAYEDALSLLADGADLRYVMNSIFYAFYYPVPAMLSTLGIPAAMQSSSIMLFERHFRDAGIMEDRLFRSLRTAFDLKPKCSDAVTFPIDRASVQTLLADAAVFLESLKKAVAPDKQRGKKP